MSWSLVVGVCLAAVATHQLARAQEAAPAQAAPAAPASAPGTISGTLPRLQSQRQTVEELLRIDAEAALAEQAKLKAAMAASSAAAAAPVSAPGAGMPSAVALPPLPDFRAADPAASIAVQAIYGTRSTESDDRVVEALVNGRAATLRAGDLHAGYRMIGIKGGCALFVKERAAGRSPGKPVKPSRSSKPAAAAKPREVCLDDVDASDDNALTFGAPGGLPNPIYNPTALPGQPVFAQPGSVNSGFGPPPVPRR